MTTKALRLMIQEVGKQWSLSPEGRAALAEVGRELMAIEGAAKALSVSGETKRLAEKGLVLTASIMDSIAGEEP